MKLQLRNASGDGIGVFALVAGLLIGALLMVAAVPRSATQTVVSRPDGDATATGGAGALAGDGAGSAGDGASGGAQAAGSAGAAAGTARGRSGAGSGGAAGANSAPTASARGVTTNSVRIGVAYPDLTALKALGPAYDNGDVPAQWNALLEGWKRDKRLPAAGRAVEFVFRNYNVVDTGSQRAACSGFVQDDKVFAVIGVAYFQVGSECVAREFHTPLVTSDGPTDAVFAQSGGNLFSLYLSQDSIVRNWAKFAADRGLIKGKAVGVYYNTAGNDPQLSKLLEGEVTRYGATKVVFATTDQGLGGPNDALAAHRFQVEGVKTVFLFTSMAGFMQQAQQQGYKPAYSASDYLFGTADSTMSTAPPEQFDGSYGITVTHNGEFNAGIAPPPSTLACIDNYKRVTGKQPNPPGSAEYNYILLSCDFGNALLYALNTAGRSLTPQTFNAALETYRSTETSQVGGLAFSRSRHSGADRVRTIQWHADCKCWKAIGSYYPLLAP